MVKCSNCKFGHHVLIRTDYNEILEEMYFCSAIDEYISTRQALDDLPCDLYVEKLDDHETEKP